MNHQGTGSAVRWRQSHAVPFPDFGEAEFSENGWTCIDRWKCTYVMPPRSHARFLPRLHRRGGGHSQLSWSWCDVIVWLPTLARSSSPSLRKYWSRPWVEPSPCSDKAVIWTLKARFLWLCILAVLDQHGDLQKCTAGETHLCAPESTANEERTSRAVLKTDKSSPYQIEGGRNTRSSIDLESAEDDNRRK